jgi:excinuclease UvrABC nuclease subunit
MENLRFSMSYQFNFFENRLTPDVPGVYALLGEYKLDGTRNVLYIGQTADLNGRLSRHLNDMRFSRVKYFKFHFENSLSQRLVIERNLIALLRPPLNIQHNPPLRSKLLG